MIEPTGYTALDLVGFTDKGTYAANVNYVKNDLVHHGGNIWRILIDDTIGIIPAEGPNYTIFMGEPTNLIERIIAPLEDNPATVAYQTGRQIIYNDHLYEVIQNIGVGDILIAYEDDPTNANIKLASPVETQVLALNASKVNKSDVVNNVTTTTAGKVLDARQGKTLQDAINTKVNKSDVVNNVTTTTAGKVLDARQGKVLQDGINTVETQVLALDTRLTAAVGDIEDLSKRATRRNFVLVGDSFGVGIIDSHTPWTTGWERYMYNLFPGRVAYFDPQRDPGFEGAGGFTTTGTYAFIDQLDYIHDNLMGSLEDIQITDVVVLGGSNERGTESEIINAVTAFCNRAKSYYPNAQISIGCVGLQARLFVSNHAYAGYRKGVSINGGAFLGDLLNLGASRTYDSGLGHWSAAGYELFNPYIAECIISGHVNFSFLEIIPLTVNSDVEPTGTVSFQLGIRRTQNGVYGIVYNTLTYQGWYIENRKTLGTGLHTVNAFDFTGGFYPAVSSGASIDPSCMSLNKSTGMIDNAAVKMSLVLDTNGSSNHQIRISGWRRMSYSAYTDLMYTWNGSYEHKLLDSF